MNNLNSNIGVGNPLKVPSPDLRDLKPEKETEEYKISTETEEEETEEAGLNPSQDFFSQNTIADEGELRNISPIQTQIDPRLEEVETDDNEAQEARKEKEQTEEIKDGKKGVL